MSYRSRTSINDLPNWESYCDLSKECVYRKNGMCDAPRVNKGNGDAACHKMLNRDTLAMLNASSRAAGKRFVEKLARQ